MNNKEFDIKALSQAYEILIRLDSEKFNKIPKDIIAGIKENRDKEYEFDSNNIDKNLLPDTKKIITAIYASFLTNIDEKRVIYRMMELEKKKKYLKKR